MLFKLSANGLYPILFYQFNVATLKHDANADTHSYSFENQSGVNPVDIRVDAYAVMATNGK